MMMALAGALRLLVEQASLLAQAALPQTGALALVAVLTAVLVVVIRSIAVPSARRLSVGNRAVGDTVLLDYLPRSSHPDAKGHARPRAPGDLLQVS